MLAQNKWANRLDLDSKILLIPGTSLTDYHIILRVTSGKSCARLPNVYQKPNCALTSTDFSLSTMLVMSSDMRSLA